MRAVVFLAALVTLVGACRKPAAGFVCGDTACAVGEELCVARVPSYSDAPATFRCAALPEECGTGDPEGSADPCDCAASQLLCYVFHCEVQADGGIQVDCAG